MEIQTKLKMEDLPLKKSIGKVVVLLSGGIDSTTLVYYMRDRGYKVYPISFYYGQKHKKELDLANLTCQKLNLSFKAFNINILRELAPSALTRKDIEVPRGNYNEETMKITVVPNRNMVFLALATAYAIGLGIREVAYAAHSGDHAIYADCRPAFIEAIRKTIELCDDSKVSLSTPFTLLDKSEILKIGFNLGVDYSLTWSCYEGRELACGKCGTCRERLEAFEKLGKIDPIKYEG